MKLAAILLTFTGLALGQSQLEGSCYEKNRFRNVAGLKIPIQLGDGYESIKFGLEGIAKSPRPKFDSFQSECLYFHNLYRELMGVPKMSTNSQLVNDAAGYARYLASSGKFEHSQNRNGAGENLYTVTNGDKSCFIAIHKFFEEYSYYRGEILPNGPFHDYGHYTQLIWPTSTQLGCAQASNGGRFVTVCRYLAAGNTSGRRINAKVMGTTLQ